MTLLVNSKSPASFVFQVVNGGQGLMAAIAGPGAIAPGRAYRQTASAGSIQRKTASLSGSYAYLLSGVAYMSGNSYQYTQTGSMTGKGLGHMSATGMANVSGNAVSATGQGPYAAGSDCSGTAALQIRAATRAITLP